MNNSKTRVVTAEVLPLGERTRIGIVSGGRFQVWELGKGWGKWYKSTEFRAVRDANAAQIAEVGLDIRTWEPWKGKAA